MSEYLERRIYERFLKSEPSIVKLIHLSSASPRGGGPRADVGTLLIVHFKVLVFPHPWGIFFLAKSPVFGETKHATGFEDALQNLILVLSTVSKHSDFVNFFIQTLYHRTKTYTLTPLKGVIDRYSSLLSFENRAIKKDD